MVKGGMYGEGGVCMAKVGCAWQRGVCMVRGHVWQRGACMVCTPPSTRYGQSMHGRYTSYWNAFLFYKTFTGCQCFIPKSVDSRKVLVFGLKEDYPISYILYPHIVCSQTHNHFIFMT